MLLALLALITVVTVPLAGGRLRCLADLRLRWVWVLAGALAAQVVIISVIPEGDVTIHRSLHLATYVVVLTWLLANRAIPWRWLLVAGGLANFTVIVANGGVMPASRAALIAAGQAGQRGFDNSSVVADPKLAFLGDVLAVPDWMPFANVFSVGDLLLVVGIFLVVHRICESYPAYLIARTADGFTRPLARLLAH